MTPNSQVQPLGTEIVARLRGEEFNYTGLIIGTSGYHLGDGNCDLSSAFVEAGADLFYIKAKLDDKLKNFLTKKG